ncbi:MAG: hypothetical protein IIW14_06000 [Kiritimatiellae bacterium]|nr:hypothetical protein [Kiritimatiellia bacterium]
MKIAVAMTQIGLSTRNCDALTHLTMGVYQMTTVGNPLKIRVSNKSALLFHKIFTKIRKFAIELSRIAPVPSRIAVNLPRRLAFKSPRGVRDRHKHKSRPFRRECHQNVAGEAG